MYTSQPTVMFLTETWLNDKLPDSLINVPGYSLYRHDRTGKRGGGACILVKNEVNGIKLKSNQNTNYHVPDSISAVWINVTFSHSTFLLGCVYRPNDITLNDNTMLLNTLSQVYESNVNTLIFGDFNYPQINWNNHSLDIANAAAQDFLDKYLQWNVWQIVKEKTRYRGNQSSLLDLLLTSDQKLISNVEYLPPIGKSDHSVIFAIAQFQLHDKHTNKVLKRKFWKDIYDEVNQHLTVNLEEQMKRTPYTYNDLEQAISEAIEVFFPLENCRTNSKKPWLTEGIFKEIDRKRKLWHRYQARPSTENYELYMQQNNQLRKNIRDARTLYEESLLGKDEKHFYNYVKRSLNSKHVEIVLKDPVNQKAIPEIEKTAELLAEQFSKVYTIEDLSNMPQLPPQSRISNEISGIQITEEKVLVALNSLKNNSSPGPDDIPSLFLKRCSKSLAPLLVKVLQDVVVTGNIPPNWSKAYVIPIFKKGNRYDPANYRPISLTCHLCKVLEKIIVPELTSFLVSNHVIPSTQHGFLPQRSTSTNLIECLNLWTKDYDEGRPIDILYLDQEKAFDKVPLKRLSYKLEHFGVRGNLLTFIEGLLINRSFQVRANGVYSKPKEVLSGVPQGSVIGPLLFITYLSDLSQLITTNISCFADDTKLFCNPALDLDQFEQDIKTLEDWTHLWLLKLNEEKCTVLHIGTNNPCNTYFLGGKEIKVVNEQKDLGIIISKNLKWNMHISQTVKKANTLIYLIQKAFTNNSVEMMKKIYTTFIRPKLEYAHIVWNPYFVKDIETLERVQRKFTKIPNALRDTPYQERLAIFGLTSLKERRDRGDLIETYKILNNNYSPFLNLNIFTRNANENLRGHSMKLSKERCSGLVRKNFLSNRVVYRWNALSENTVTALNKNLFKNRLDENLLSINTSLVHYL